MILSVDHEFHRFLTRVSLTVAWREKPQLPDVVLIARAYQDDTDAILRALRSGSRARLEIAMGWGWAA